VLTKYVVITFYYKLRNKFDNIQRTGIIAIVMLIVFVAACTVCIFANILLTQ